MDYTSTTTTTLNIAVLKLFYTGICGFRWATENVPNRQPTACTTIIVAHRFFRFLGRQLEVAPFETCVATSSQLIAYPVAHRFTTSAVDTI